MSLIKTLPTKQILLLLLLLRPGSLAFSQTDTLSLASGSAAQGGSVQLNLSLNAATAPAALQWVISYSSDVTSVNFAVGPALSAASKTITCNPSAGSTICLADGMNANTISNGVVATVTVKLASTTSTGSVPLTLSGTAAVLGTGVADTMSGTGSTVTVTGWQPAPITISSLACNPLTVVTPGNSNCTVTLSAASSTAVTVAVSGGSPLSAPASVIVAANAASASFTVSAASVSASQTAGVTVSLNGSSASNSLTLQPAGVVAPGTVAAYAFDEGTGATTADASGN